MDRLDAYFRVVGLSSTRTLADLRRDLTRYHPSLTRAWSPSVIHPSETDTWSSPRGLPAGSRWAAVCWKDKIAAPNGFFVVPVGIAGTIRVR
jgi:hypothetical protein